jgi:hypothetical protein
MARPSAALDQAVAVEDGVDGASGRNTDVAGQSPDQQFADLAGAPVRLLALKDGEVGSTLSAESNRLKPALLAMGGQAIHDYAKQRALRNVALRARF